MPNKRYPKDDKEREIVNLVDGLSEGGATPAEIARLLNKRGYKNRWGRRFEAHGVERLIGRTRPEGMVQELVTTERSFEARLALSLEVLRVAAQKDERAARAFLAFQGVVENGGTSHDAIRAARESLGMPPDWE